MTCSSVVFPEPDGPTTETSSPCSIVRLMSLSAATAGAVSYRLCTSLELDRGGHVEGTSTRIPGRSCGELTWTGRRRRSRRDRDQVLRRAMVDRDGVAALPARASSAGRGRRARAVGRYR